MSQEEASFYDYKYLSEGNNISAHFIGYPLQHLHVLLSKTTNQLKSNINS